MKKIKDFSKAIGLIGRGGIFFPSNEKSAEKLNHVFDAANVPKPFATTFRKEELVLMAQLSKAAGYQLVITERGLNR